jgi:hypothetical protein
VKCQCGSNGKNDNGGGGIWMVRVKDDKDEEMVHIQCLQLVINMAMNCLAINVGANLHMCLTSIANIDMMVVHHLQHQGGGCGGGSDRRNRDFFIDLTLHY